MDHPFVGGVIKKCDSMADFLFGVIIGLMVGAVGEVVLLDWFERLWKKREGVKNAGKDKKGRKNRNNK